ncbi:cation-dependent mannose-6-phosphate receptor isoform X2 [Austrofundulus limnaeus]|uniref:Cation-dependent mannose-6-phosphate receptor n=1 Tax=Austrofundulus limnaeus TaxID=52670 RepID=A0A2I4BK27_AUSLI|nr:PREDICTED: cation-dependent mannose-6-phosphate receptor isoform X2 [Austrofundulus limnaeus]
MQLFSVPRQCHITLQTFMVLLVLCRSCVFAGNGTKACKLIHESQSERKVLDRLEPLVNKNFTFDQTEGEDSYTYVFQLCGDAGGVPQAGAIQVNKKDKKIKKIGLYTLTKAVGGSDWVMLIYDGGDKYDHHCSQKNRTAMVMISCDKNVDMGNFKVILEDREREHDCFYLFELDSSAVCPAVQSQLSAGSIILIIGFCLMAVYLIGGFLYQRLIVRAKGMEQFPNYAFWVEVGNLTADGCDFVCRSKNREASPGSRGVTTEPLEEEPEERDDHLLPM